MSDKVKGVIYNVSLCFDYRRLDFLQIDSDVYHFLL